MSQQEIDRRKKLKKIFHNAWRLYRLSSNKMKSFSIIEFAKFLKAAWALAKKAILHKTRIHGVTFDNEKTGVNRQRILKRLFHYSREQISINCEREPKNPYDPNAIKVIASVANKGKAVIGYLPRQLAKEIAPQIDNGSILLPFFGEIISNPRFDRLGCSIYYLIIQ